MNFKTSTTFEGRVLNGEIKNDKVVLDELLGVSLVKEKELSCSDISQLIIDLQSLQAKLDKSYRKVATIDDITSSKVTYGKLSSSVDINNHSWNKFIELIENKVSEINKSNKHL